MWAGAAMGFVATRPFMIHFWCRADLPLAHERTDVWKSLCGRGRSGSRLRHSIPSSYGVTVAACISMMQVNVRLVVVRTCSCKPICRGTGEGIP